MFTCRNDGRWQIKTEAPFLHWWALATCKQRKGKKRSKLQIWDRLAAKTEGRKNMENGGSFTLVLRDQLGLVSCQLTYFRLYGDIWSYVWNIQYIYMYIRNDTMGELPFYVIDLVEEISLFTTVVLQMGLHSWQKINNNVQKLPGYWVCFFIHVREVAVDCPEKLPQPDRCKSTAGGYRLYKYKTEPGLSEHSPFQSAGKSIDFSNTYR